MALREDMKARLDYVYQDRCAEGMDLITAILSQDDTINECAKTALMDTKMHLMAFFPLVQNLERTIGDGDDPIDAGTARSQIKMITQWLQRWDSELASQA